MSGDIPSSDYALSPAERRRIFKLRAKDAKDGHAAPCGSGPASETCGKCRFFVSTRNWQAPYQCSIAGRNRQHGIGSADAACKFWEPQKPR